MTQAFRSLSSTNGYMVGPSEYIIDFIKDEKSFPLMRYTQIVEAPAPTFFWYEIDRDQIIRQHSRQMQAWADGADRPITHGNQVPFREVQATTVRNDVNSRIGNQALKYNKWKAKEIYLKALACQAMIGRTYDTLTLLQTVANWPSTNTADAAVLNGGAGFWSTASDDPADANYNAILKSLSMACQTIFLQTNGQVRWKDLRLVLSPNLARQMANSPELHNYIRQSDAAIERITGDVEDYTDRFGLPRRLYGVEIVVEDTPYLADNPVAGFTTGSTARQFMKNDTSAILVSRPGGIDGYVGPTFSTTQLYWSDYNMAVFEFTDDKNAYTDLHVTDQTVSVLPAPYSGYLITNCAA